MSTKTLLLIFLLVILVALSSRAVVKIMEPRYLFHPDMGLEMNPAMLELKFENVVVRSGEDLIHGWYFPGDPKNGILLFFHGNAGNMADRLGFIKYLEPLSLNILMIDYRGYGKSEGSPSIKGVEEDGLAAIEWLLKKNKVPPGRIVLWGRSMGGAVALAVAQKYPDVAGVIVESTFVSLRRIAFDLTPMAPQAFVTDAWKNGEIISQIKTPKLIIHGTADSLIPFAHGKELFERALVPKQFIPVRGADHNNTYIRGGEKYRRLVGGWIREQIK